ncbi:MAG: NYN domain-containing protein [Acidimicrobiales bacterium]
MLYYFEMPSEHIVVDGSNIATEGRNEPSLAQLEAAVAELRREYPHAEVTVIVDATFSHRIDRSELARFEAGVVEGEYVHPPAGAIGRGDAFLLRVAEKVDAIVLSNDSFQEFHGEHPWLFDRGRLIGATPVPGVGWIFSPRNPVRGPTSRRVVRDSDRAKKKVSKAIAVATKEAAGSPRPASEAGSAAGRPSAAAASVNDPLSFISFIAEHPLGAEVDGEVESYTSHGAVVMVGGTQCYLPLANMAVPAPRAAREAVRRKERRSFVVTALDPQRRGVELSLPGVGAVSGHPSEETIAAELKLVKKKVASAKGVPGGGKKAPLAAMAPKAKAAPVGKPAAPAGPAAARATKATAAGKTVAAPARPPAPARNPATARQPAPVTPQPRKRPPKATPASPRRRPGR